MSAMMCIMTSSLLFGLSRSLAWAIAARSLGGLSNGNVGIIRTTVAELVPYKNLQPKAFSIMPLVWTIGSIFGPSLGGALASPARKYPWLFDTAFFRTFPFALPNLVAACFFLFGLVMAFLFLEVYFTQAVCTFILIAFRKRLRQRKIGTTTEGHWLKRLPDFPSGL